MHPFLSRYRWPAIALALLALLGLYALAARRPEEAGAPLGLPQPVAMGPDGAGGAGPALSMAAPPVEIVDGFEDGPAGEAADDAPMDDTAAMDDTRGMDPSPDAAEMPDGDDGYAPAPS